MIPSVTPPHVLATPLPNLVLIHQVPFTLGDVVEKRVLRVKIRIFQAQFFP